MYLCGAGAGFNPGAEFVLCDLAVVVPAVEQAERHRVLLPDKPACITKSLQARQSVSCTERKTQISLPASPSVREVIQRHIHHKHCYLKYRLVLFHLITSRETATGYAYFGVDHQVTEARIKNNKHRPVNDGYRSVCATVIHGISKKASVTILGIRAALVTDAHQSIETQKGNPPSRAHHQHHHVSPFCRKL